jgi:Uma2 family endonuclease
MNSRPHPPSTLYDELCRLPEGIRGELLGGQLHTQPRPSGKHGLAERALSIDLGGPFDFGRGGPGGWWIIPEPEVHFVRDTEVVVPDLAGWRRERMPTVPNDHRFEITPDWVCEILSPSTLRRDRIVKLPLYARYGVPHAWLIDPDARTLEAFELRQGYWVLIASLQESDMVKVPPFDASLYTQVPVACILKIFA